MPELSNPQYEEFALRFIACHNTSRAATQAGFSAQYGNNLLRDPAVKERIAELLTEKFTALHMTADEVLGQLARIARADVRDLYEESGKLKSARDLDENVVAAIAGMDSIELGESGTLKKVKLTPRLEALKVLAQYHKLVGAETQISVYANLADRMEEADTRQKSVASSPDDLIG